MADVSKITFEFIVDGQRRVFEYVRPIKIEELLLSKEELGEFLGSMAFAEVPVEA